MLNIWNKIKEIINKTKIILNKAFEKFMQSSFFANLIVLVLMGAVCVITQFSFLIFITAIYFGFIIYKTIKMKE